LSPTNTPLAIVGIGCLFPKAPGAGFYWANVKNGVDCIEAIPPSHWNPEEYFDVDPKSPDMTYAQRGGFLSAIDFNPMEFGISLRDIEATDTSQLLGLVAAKQALTDARIDLTRVDRNRISVILGVTGTLELVIPLGARLGHPKWKQAMKEAGIPDEAANDASERIAESYVPWQENSFPGLLGNVVAGRIANKLDLGGTNCVVDAACASSLSAVHLASLELQAGRADVVVSGGIDTFNDIFMYMCFSKTPALSPTGDAKPFDVHGDGTILGEGLGVVVLKRQADAERDGDTIYAVLKGVGSSSDGKGNAIYAPSPEGQKKAILNAYRLADVTPDTIELVEAHGTGTRVGDTAEITALTEVYSSLPLGAGNRPLTPWCALGSVKSMIGHTKAAAGAASLIKVALSLYNKVLPPTLKVSQPVEPLRAADTPFYVNTSMRPWLPRAGHPRRAAMSAFGFGGSNFHAVLEEYQPEKAEPDWDGSVEIVALSGDARQGIAEEVERMPIGDWPAFARFAEQSRSTFQVNAPLRLTFAARRGTDLAKLLTTVKDSLAGHANDGVFLGEGPLAGKVAVLFPGQGSQYVGMLRELACLFPEMLESLAAANGEVVLSDRIYPPPRFDADRQKADEAVLRDTRHAQPAIGAVSFGAWQVLHDRFGLNADAFAGHSYGELVALAAAERISSQDLFKLSWLRGELMARQRAGDPGSMLAVLAPLAEIEAVLHKHDLKLVVANKNAPKQTVLSGAAAEVERATQAFAGARMKYSRLPVAAAFHSEFVADAAGPFREALEGISFVEAGPQVFANTTAKEYPADAASVRDLLGNQLAKPVQFVDQIRAMAESGVRTFVEVGPGSVLTRLVESILTDSGTSGVEAFALDASSGKRSGVLELGAVLARLAARGVALHLNAWEAESRCRPLPPAKAGLTVPLCGANYVMPRDKRPPRPIRVSSMSDSNGARPSDPNAIATALAMTQQTLAALQRMQEQTAQLHRQFLESQESSRRTLQSLVDQQKALLATSFGIALPAPPVAYPPLPAIAAPVSVPPQPVFAIPPRVAAVTAPQPAAKPRETSSGAATVASTLLAVVAEKTGYPVSSLDLKLSLDSDLGVDSIKRVEILSTLQEKLPHAPQVKPEHLGTLHTLQDVADFLNNGAASHAPLEEEGPRTQQISREQLLVLTREAAHAPGNNGDVATALLAVVAEKTGYPVASLDLKLSLDSDLGVDSIKRVEILSALQERLPKAPQVKPEHLGTLHTLQDVADFLRGGAPVRSEAPATAKMTLAPMLEAPATLSELAAPETEHVSSISSQVTDSILHRARETTNLATPAAVRLSPADSLASRSAANLSGTERIDRSILQVVDIDPTSPRPRVPLPRGGEIWVVGDADGLTEQVVDKLASLGFNARMMGWSGPGANRPAGPLSGLVLIAPVAPGPDSGLNKLAFEWLQHVAAKLRQAGRQGAAVFATVAKLDGAFGLNKLSPEADPTAGGLAGLAKTARHEWPEVSCKAIDLDPAFASPAAAAGALVDEILIAGPVEIGVGATHRCVLELARTVRRPNTQAFTLGPKDVILVTGGARGVTAETAVALGEAFGCTLILTGRTPTPPDEPEWLAGLTGESEIKQAISQKLGAEAGPRQIGDHYHRIMAQREIRRTLKRIETAGGRGAYYPVDVAAGKSVADLLQKIRVKFGPVTAIVHGAGVLADRRIEDLSASDFDRVYSTKVEGLRNLLDMLSQEELKAIVLFSSVTARYGRTGQLAYAAANEVLNKTAQVEARRRPGCRVVSINWGPWEGGMVTPALRKQFELEGVGLIPLADGGLFLVHELNASGKAVEVLALGKPRPAGSGLVPTPGSRAAEPSGGSAASSAPTVSPPNAAPPAEMAAVFDRTIDVETHPILRSHVLDGRAVLPIALHIEFLAHAALHGHPGLLFHGFNDLRITQAVKVDADESVALRAYAGKAVKQDQHFLVPVELRSQTKGGREMLKSKAEIVLHTTALPKPPAADRPPPAPPYPHTLEFAYRELLFHGPDLHGLESITGASEFAFLGTANPAPAPGEWLQFPLRSSWIADPLVIDCSFQLMCLWSRFQHQQGSVPNFVGRYRQYRRGFPDGPISLVVRITRDNGTFARADIDYLDPDGRIVAQVQDYECVIEKSMNQAYRRNQLGILKT
jgi:acyl transferase domain-containing protein/NAD(P)-dependent dehydrogenase (short-subunit alcohol dehydrogenase family)/acyl carrier protein